MKLQKIGNQGMLFVGCTAAMIWENAGIWSVVYALFACILCCMVLYVEEEYLIGAGILLYAVAIYKYQPSIMLLPLLLANMLGICLRNRKCLRLLGILCIFACILLIKWLPGCSHVDKLYLLVIAVFGVWLTIWQRKYQELLQRYIKTQDDSTELTLMMQSKNQFLLEKQDSDIRNATLKERNRIAREIHDNVGHMLTRSILLTGAILATSKDESSKESLETLKESLDDAMTTIRNSVHNLHEESVDVHAALRDIIKEVPDFSIQLEYDMSNMVPMEIKYCVIAVVKEALANALRHSKGDRILISTIEHPAFYKILVEDNGECEAKELLHTKGIGLINIRSRIETVGGTLDISSTRKGFRIFASIPKNIRNHGGR